jgi:outer membrane receptor for ferrienterochelin and colicin
MTFTPPKLILVFILLGICNFAFTQVDSVAIKAYYEQNADSLLAVEMAPELKELVQPTTVSTGTALHLHNTPNVITVVTREEIETSGARDLMDVLRLMPGVTFAQGNDGSIGISMRGNWANEGKVLLLMDGQELNDIYGANLNFANHYPADMIERVELIRGPGSALYGGFAEFGVINLITRGPDQFKGLTFGYNFGQMARTNGFRQRNWYFGQKWGNSSISFLSFAGSGMRSDQEHFGFYRNQQVDSMGRIGRATTMAGNSRVNPRINQFKIQMGKWSFQSIVDLYAYDDIRQINREGERNRLLKLRRNYTELKYVHTVNDKLQIIPRFNWVVQFPVLGEDSSGLGEDDARISRFRSNVSAHYKPNHRTDITGGVEWFRDKAENRDLDVRNPLFIQGEQVSYHNLAAYGQAVLKRPWANLTLGARLDANTRYGAAFSPRLAVTKRMRAFHVKLMASRAFRAPSVGNIARAFDGSYSFNEDSTRIIGLKGDIQAERTWVQEAEIGLQLGNNGMITANFFNITSYDPIVFSFYSDQQIIDQFGEGAGLYVYQNATQSGTQGFELEGRYKHKKGFIHANYSYYFVGNKERVPAYQVSTFNYDPSMREEVESGQLLSFPSHRFNLNATFYPVEDISINVSGSYLGKRYGYDVSLDGNGTDWELKEIEPTILTQAFVRYDRLLNGHLKLGFGVYDILNQRIRYYQPYQGLNTSVPGPSREIVLKASWDLLRFGQQP